VLRNDTVLAIAADACAVRRAKKEWKMPPRAWTMAKAQFAGIFGERFFKAMAA
jgi:transposase-like protein